MLILNVRGGGGMKEGDLVGVIRNSQTGINHFSDEMGFRKLVHVTMPTRGKNAELIMFLLL